MPQDSYAGRHRPSSTPSRARKFVVPVILLASTAAGGLVIRSAGASELGASANAAQGAGGVDANALAAARADRDTARASRDSDRDAALLANASAAVTARASLAAKSAADKAEKAAEAKAAQAKAAQAKAAQAKAAQAKQAAAAAALAKARRWVAPLSGYTLTSGYGMRWGKLHPAQDLATAVGTPVHALSSGTVVSAGWSNEGYGNLVKIRYWDGTVSWMAHNTRLDVAVGQSVAPGQVVAHSGNTGRSTGPHVHLEIHPGDGDAVPPMSWLAKHGVTL